MKKPYSKAGKVISLIASLILELIAFPFKILIGLIDIVDAISN